MLSKNEFNKENEIANDEMDESEHYLIERDDKYGVRPDEKIKSVIDVLEVAIDHLGNLELEEYELTEGSRLLRIAKFLIDSIIDDVENEYTKQIRKMHLQSKKKFSLHIEN